MEMQVHEANERRPAFPQGTFDEQKDQKLEDINNMSHPGEPAFSEDEIQNLREIFDLFDREKQGTIEAKDLHTIMGSLHRDPTEVNDLIANLGQGEAARITF